MENPEEVLSWLEEAARRRPATIPRELDEYLAWVARTGESVYRWPLVRSLLKEKLLQVLHEFRTMAPPPPTCSPNVPPFDADAMRAVALARLDAFPAPPFTIQRICELLAHPRRHYNRLDKFMRAFEKNVLVVSTKEPDSPRRPDDGDADPEERRPLASLNGPPLSESEPADEDDDRARLSRNFVDSDESQIDPETVDARSEEEDADGPASPTIGDRDDENEESADRETDERSQGSSDETEEPTVTVAPIESESSEDMEISIDNTTESTSDVPESTKSPSEPSQESIEEIGTSDSVIESTESRTESSEIDETIPEKPSSPEEKVDVVKSESESESESLQSNESMHEFVETEKPEESIENDEPEKPAPMDCAEDEKESVSETPNEENEVDEKMITEDNGPSLELVQNP